MGSDAVGVAAQNGRATQQIDGQQQPFLWVHNSSREDFKLRIKLS